MEEDDPFAFKEGDGDGPRPRLKRMLSEIFERGDRIRKRQKNADDTDYKGGSFRTSSSGVGSRTRSKSKNGVEFARSNKGVLPVQSYKNVEELEIVEESTQRKLEEEAREKRLKEEEEMKAEILMQEALSMSRLHALVFPQGDPDPVTITHKDIRLLQPSQFLNDTIIDFYIKYLQTTLSPAEKAKAYFFNSFFFTKLVELSERALSIEEAQSAYARLEKWTEKENIFEKDYIFIPVNRTCHWSLLVICYLNDMLPKELSNELHSVATCILHFDSFDGFHADIEPFIRNYLSQEWNRRKSKEHEQLQYHFDQIKFVRLKVPQQNNSHDCGLFLLHYVELFLERCFASRSNLSWITMDWFEPAQASAKRHHLLRLIHGLIQDMYTKKLHSQGESCSKTSSDSVQVWEQVDNEPDNEEELIMHHGPSPNS